jgi:hypothetical protein
MQILNRVVCSSLSIIDQAEHPSPSTEALAEFV